MLSIPNQAKIYFCVAPREIRKGFDTLAEMFRESLRLDPMAGQLFVFRSRRGDRVKLLYWNEDGWCLC